MISCSWNFFSFTFCLSIIYSLVNIQARGFVLMVNPGEERGRTGECIVLLLSLIYLCMHMLVYGHVGFSV